MKRVVIKCANRNHETAGRRGKPNHPGAGKPLGFADVPNNASPADIERIANSYVCDACAGEWHKNGRNGRPEDA